MRLIFCLFLVFFVASSNAHTYKCKDKSGNWTEQACPDYEQRMQLEAQKAAQQTALRNWEPKIGMSADEIRRVIKSEECRSTRAFKWCGYYKINATKTVGGTREQWVFTNVNGMPLWYLYFNNGILVTIQD
ncbi:DUF4124 domain-containing protein [Acidovorax sp. 210-6]|uniref:DUF4124 domain-containing protein n=1 Tax=Acidovorax sp. 210-6 TaxID=2699468 RepID=UPI00138A2DAB|nr:DUF4124 domain-containing protein [Acidovorax sp. 210-6]NCU66092.1 DUF4124 domain-containing protein [Acidovorax sp. 210-6]